MDPIPYRLRRKCVDCKEWCHGTCVEACICLPSASKIREIVAEARLDGLSGEIVIAMLYLGPDDARIASHMGADPEAVAIMCQRLRDNDIWRDGKVCLESIDKPDEIVIELALIACVAEGWVESRPA